MVFVKNVLGMALCITQSIQINIYFNVSYLLIVLMGAGPCTVDSVQFAQKYVEFLCELREV